MKYHELSITKHKSTKRVGRGIASGKGKTAGRGTKGQGARTGSSKRPGFEGGQNPLMQRLPKLPGFRSHRVKPEIVYTNQLEQLKAKTVDNAAVAEAGLVSSPYVAVKVLSRGDVTKALAVKLQGASLSAIEAIQKAGGEFVQTPQVGRTKLAKNVKKSKD